MIAAFDQDGRLVLNPDKNYAIEHARSLVRDGKRLVKRIALWRMFGLSVVAEPMTAALALRLDAVTDEIERCSFLVKSVEAVLERHPAELEGVG